MTKTVYFYKNISKVLPNHTMSFSKRESFSHSGCGRQNLSMKNSNFSVSEFANYKLPFWDIV